MVLRTRTAAGRCKLWSDDDDEKKKKQEEEQNSDSRDNGEDADVDPVMTRTVTMATAMMWW